MIPENVRFYRPIITVRRDGSQSVEIWSGFALRVGEWFRAGGTGALQRIGTFGGITVLKSPAALMDIRRVMPDADIIVDCKDNGDPGRKKHVEQIKAFFQARGLEEEVAIRQE